MDKHIKRLDVKIRDLQAEGLFPADPITLPIHPPTADNKTFFQLPSHSRVASRRVSPSINVRPSSLALDKSTVSGNSTPTTTGGPTSTNHISSAVSGPPGGPTSIGTPGSVPGHDNKRRRLASTSGASGGGGLSATVGNTPLISSTLANSGTTTPGPGSAGLSGRGSAEAGRTADGAAVTARTGPGMKRGGGLKHGGGAHKRRGVQHEQEDEEEEEEDEDDDDEENGDDKRLYCYCQQVSWGNMVACDDSDCRYEWFHWGMPSSSSPCPPSCVTPDAKDSDSTQAVSTLRKSLLANGTATRAATVEKRSERNRILSIGSRGIVAQYLIETL